jgi:hypothetical protein
MAGEGHGHGLLCVNWTYTDVSVVCGGTLKDTLALLVTYVTCFAQTLESSMAVGVIVVSRDRRAMEEENEGRKAGIEPGTT